MTLLAAAAALVAGSACQPGGSLASDDSQVSPSRPPDVGEWRTEAWRNLAVEVPAGWGWGTAPTGSDPGPLCGGPGPTVRADGGTGSDPTLPWVGRPVPLSDVCVAADQLGQPTAPYVWLGAELEPGTVELGGGWVRETVSAYGSTVTVASDDPVLRSHVLASAHGVRGCFGVLDAPPEADYGPTEGIRPVRTAELCAYRPDGDGWSLAYAGTLDEAAAQATYDAMFAGQRRSPPVFCDDAREYVALTFTGDDAFGSEPVSHRVVLSVACRQVQGAPGLVAPVSEGALEPWSRNGVRTALSELVGPQG